MTPTFTPEDVVRRYQELGIRPRAGALGVEPRDGRWCHAGQGCCAMGVMLVGLPVGVYDPVDHRRIAEEQLGVSFRDFYRGFDLILGAGQLEVDDASFQLGVACRRAVLDADMIILGSS